MSKRIAYLGGYYPAEQSMARSFNDHYADIVFPYNTEPRYAVEHPARHPKPSRSSSIPVIAPPKTGDPLFESGFMMQRQPNCLVYVPDKNLESWMDEYKPDVVVHRYYFDNPVMHSNSREVAAKLGIPFVVYRMETMPTADFAIRPIECDLFLYANKCDEKYIMQENKDWWSWGVSHFERNLNKGRNLDIAGFGYFNHNSVEKHENLFFFIQAAKQIKRKIAVYWGEVTPEWAYISRELDIHQKYCIEEQTDRMNNCKVAINFETIAAIPGCWSHKIWQTMGCGTPTISMRKPEYNDMFEGALMQCGTIAEANNLMTLLLHHNDAFWKYISKMSEQVVHDKFEWFENFDRLMKEHNIW